MASNTYQRSIELKSIREFAVLQVMDNKTLTTSSLMPILTKEFGKKLDGIKFDTVSNWIYVGRNDGKNPFPRGNKKKQKGIIMIQTTGTLSKKPTFNEVLSSFSSQQELANFLLDGFLQIAKERNELRTTRTDSIIPLENQIRELSDENKLLKEKLKLVTTERDRCMKIHNESLVNNTQSNINKKPRTLDDALAIIRNEKTDIRVPKRGEII